MSECNCVDTGHKQDCPLGKDLRIAAMQEEIAILQSELAAAKESRDRESVAYDKLNAAYIDLNLELSKLRTTEYEYLLGEKDAQIDALRAKSTELKTSPLYACACEQFYDGKHHPECPARRQWEELQSDLAAARAELARAKPALIKAWEIFFTRSFSQDPIGRAEARYAREIAHNGEEG